MSVSFSFSKLAYFTLYCVRTSFFQIVYMGVLAMHHVCIYCLWRPKEGVGSPGTGVTGTCVLGAGNGKLKASVRTVLLLSSEPSLQPLLLSFIGKGLLLLQDFQSPKEPNK